MASNTVITFDDLGIGTGQEARIADGYAGFNWVQAGAYSPNGALPGYTATSGSTIAFIAEAGNTEIAGYEDANAGSALVFTREKPFDLLSADLSAAFRNGINITVTAFADEAGAVSLGSVTLLVNQGAQTFSFENSLFTGARRIEINGNDGDAATLDYFGIDNLTLRDTVTTIGFDDIALVPGGEARIADGYAGFQWNGVGVYRPDGAIAGYQATDGTNIAFIAEANGNEIGGYEDHVAGTAAVITRDSAFSFVGADFSAAFRDDLDLTIRAYADAAGQVLVGTAQISVDRGATSFTFADGVNVAGTFSSIERLEFASNDGNPSTNDYFGFDHFQFII
jgi:hypothetical protein